MGKNQTISTIISKAIGLLHKSSTTEASKLLPGAAEAMVKSRKTLSIGAKGAASRKDPGPTQMLKGAEERV